MDGTADRGQATIGVALIIALTIIGTVAVIALGATALSDLQVSSETGSAELAMTQFDSQASQVALGDSRTQTIDIGQNGGTYQVDPTAGHVRIVHVNFDGKMQDDGDDIAGSSPSGVDDEELIYETDLGTLTFERSGTTFAYQGGGVWRRSEQGGSTMVSPPEFHYRSSTLTFPIVRVNQETGAGVSAVQSGSGSPTLRVTKADEPVDIYPDPTSGYPSTDDDDGDGTVGDSGDDGFVDESDPGGGDDDNDGGAFRNPAQNGKVVVYITSEYYGAWAEYFETRTDGTVDTSDTSGGYVDSSDDPDGSGPKGVVAVELSSTGNTGRFQMPGDGGSILVRGITEHRMNDYTITLRPDTNDEANFKNLQWSMYADDGDKEFELHLRYDKSDDDASTACKEGLYSLYVFYSPDGTDDYHGWVNEQAYRSHCVDTDGDGTKETAELTADFVDDPDSDGPDDIESHDPMLEYQSLSNKNVEHFGLNGRSVIDDEVIDVHDPSPDWEDGSTSYEPGTGMTQSSDRLIAHYFSLLGGDEGFDLTVDDKGSNTVTEGNSAGTINYPGGSKFITYMHITENDVTVRID